MGCLSIGRYASVKSAAMNICTACDEVYVDNALLFPTHNLLPHISPAFKRKAYKRRLSTLYFSNCVLILSEKYPYYIHALYR
jgi:hypothetical protein